MSLLFAVTCNLQAAQSPSISLVTDTQMGPAARHGVSKVRLALRAKGIQIEQTRSLETARGDLLLVLGLSREAGPTTTLHNSLDIPKPVEAESLMIHHVKWSGKKVLLVSGADDRGLMYALLDVAERIGWAEDAQNPLSEVRNIEEKPAVAERALSIYTMHQGNFESYFYDETYWARYLDMLAKNRFNTFALLFGYENWGYFSPPYPYFFDLEKFPNVKVVGITKDKQRKNLKALNRIIDMTHERGMDFTLGIWDHIYRGGVQGPRDRAGKPTEGIDSAKFLPEESSRWFARVSRDVLNLVGQAERQIGGNRNKEFDSTMVDLRILAYLAVYHSHRANAGVSWALFKRSQDLNALDDAIAHESRAIEAWERLVEAAGNIYHSNLMMGRQSAGLSGHWLDELVKLKDGLGKLKQQRSSFRLAAAEAKPVIAHVPIRKAQPGKKLVIRATVSAREPMRGARIGYRSGQSDYVWIGMKQTEPSIYRATIKAKDVTAGLKYVIEASGGHERAKTEPITVAVTVDNKAPQVKHEHVTYALAGKPLTITAQVSDAAGVKWVRLRYRSVTQFEDYKTLDMAKTDAHGEYKAVVPGLYVDAKWDFMYLIEVMDNNGNGAIYPDMEKETPYVVVKLDR